MDFYLVFERCLGFLYDMWIGVLLWVVIYVNCDNVIVFLYCDVVVVYYMLVRLDMCLDLKRNDKIRIYK